MDKNNIGRMNIVVVGHVDHGKSTLIGRLLADTSSLPEGKLEQVKEYCKNNSRPFEYAFLLDALKDEQSQGITIDSARCFFKSKKRDYLIIDAPGHIEFLKNMISGAARAEAALLVIDANEGIQENSKRHGYMLSMLGIKQIIICINKMDLVNYDENIFNNIKKEYSGFLKKINITPKEFIPVSALKGENIVNFSENLRWFKRDSVLSALDSFENEKSLKEKPFRMLVQDVYKFTENGDSRRIVAGRVESGSIKVGDKVIFLPSNKRAQIKTIEEFNVPKKDFAHIGNSVGFTLTDQIYINRGEIMCKENDNLPYISSIIKTNIFWMGKQPMQIDKEYKLKLATSKVPVKLKEIINVLDASNLSKSKKDCIERNEVAECILECQSPIAFDLSKDIEATGRFVIVDIDNCDISGGGIITMFLDDNHRGYRQKMMKNDFTIWLTGLPCSGKTTIAKKLEKELINQGYNKVVHLDGDDVRKKLNADLGFSEEGRKENLRRVAYIAQLFNEKENLVIASFVSPTNEYRKMIKKIIKNLKLIYVKCSLKECERRDTKGMYKKARKGELKEFTGISAPFEEPENPDIVVDTENNRVEECAKKILEGIQEGGRK